VAKTYALQAADPPLAQGVIGSSTPGGRVDLEEKLCESTTPKFYWKKGIFSRRRIRGVDK
jgi:hypothetical protein